MNDKGKKYADKGLMSTIEDAVDPARIIVQERPLRPFDFSELKRQFSTICTDYMEKLEGPSYKIGFFEKVVYEIDPNAHISKKSGFTRSFPLRFPNGGTLTVSSNIPKFQVRYKPEEKFMEISVDLALLLAIPIFGEVIDVSTVTESKAILTPLCGACFSSNSIAPLASALNLTLRETMKMISFSCQNLGCYLDGSDASCALVAVICATSLMKDKVQRDRVIQNKIQQYEAVGKMVDVNKAKLIASYVYYVPSCFQIDNLNRVLSAVMRLGH